MSDLDLSDQLTPEDVDQINKAEHFFNHAGFSVEKNLKQATIKASCESLMIQYCIFDKLLLESEIVERNETVLIKLNSTTPEEPLGFGVHAPTEKLATIFDLLLDQKSNLLAGRVDTFASKAEKASLTWFADV